jgi:hypothetical protein
MTPNGVGHVGIQVGGDKPGDPRGTYRSVHPWFPVFGPFIVFPMPILKATSWQEDAQSEAKGPNQDMKKPDVVFYSDNLNTPAMQSALETESEGHKYQLVPGVHPWRFFLHAAEDITYQPTERVYYPNRHFDYTERTHNCATFVAEVLRAGGIPLQQTTLPWVMTPNSVLEQLSSNPKFKAVNLDVES